MAIDSPIDRSEQQQTTYVSDPELLLCLGGSIRREIIKTKAKLTICAFTSTSSSDSDKMELSKEIRELDTKAFHGVDNNFVRG